MNTQSTQRFVSDSASTRDSARCGSTYRNSTQRFVSDAAPQRLAPRRNASLRHALQLNDLLITTHRAYTRLCAPLRCTPRRNALQRNDLLVTTPRGSLPRNFALRNATLCAATQLNSTQRFVNNSAPIRITLLRGSTPLNSTQRFVSYNVALSQLDASRLAASFRNVPQLNSTIC